VHLVPSWVQCQTLRLLPLTVLGTAPRRQLLLQNRERICRRLYFLGRFHLNDESSHTVAHRSSTTCVIHASDMHVHSRPVPVVLKMVKDRALFEHETAMLARCGESSVVASCVYAHAAVCGAGFGMDHLLQCELAAVMAFEHCLVLPCGDRTLSDVIVHDNVAGNPDEIRAVRSIMGQLASGLAHIHTVCGAIHSDFKPLNAMQFGAAWKLIDLDVAVPLGFPIHPCAAVHEDHASILCKEGGGAHATKRSTLAAPPELFQEANGLVAIRDKRAAAGELLASASYDAWSFGSVLFHLLSGSSLFHANNSDNLEAEELLALCRWTPSDCARRLDRLKSTAIRGRQGEALVEWLLQKDADHRPSMSQVVQHAFLQDDPCHSLLACSLMPASARCAHQRHPQRKLRLHCSHDVSADAAAFVNKLKDWCPVLANSTVLEVLGHALSEASDSFGVGIAEMQNCCPLPPELDIPVLARYRGRSESWRQLVSPISKGRARLPKSCHEVDKRGSQMREADHADERQFTVLRNLIESVPKECSVQAVVRTGGGMQEAQCFGRAGVSQAHLSALIKEEEGSAPSRFIAPIVQTTATYRSVECLVEWFEHMLQDSGMAGKAIVVNSDGQVRSA